MHRTYKQIHLICRLGFFHKECNFKPIEVSDNHFTDLNKLFIRI